jgi:WD40 repeat protein
VNPDGTNLRHLVHVEGYATLGSPRWSHDGKRVVFDGRKTGSAQGQLFDVAADGTDLREIGPGTLPDWSPDDKQYAFTATGSDSTKLGIYVQNVDGRGRQFLVAGTAPRWSPDGSSMAFQPGGLMLLDLVDASTRNILALDNKIRRIGHGFDWSADASRLAIVLEDADGNRELAIVAADGTGLRSRWKGPIEDVAWSPDGKTLAATIRIAMGVRRIHLLPADGDDSPAEIQQQVGESMAAAWSPDGQQLAFASSRTDVPWRATPLAAAGARLELVRSHDKGGTVYSLGLTPDGRKAFLGGDMTNRGVVVWDTASGDELRRIQMPGVFVAVSPDGRHAAAAPFIGGNVKFIDLDDGSIIRDFGHGATVTCLDFSGDGSRIATAGADKAVCTFDVASGDQLARIEHADDLKRVAFSPDGNRIAVTCADRKLHLWNAETGEKVREMEHPACPWGVAFSPDGRQVMTGTGGVLTGKPSDLMIEPEEDNTLRIWDVDTGKLLREMRGHTHTISSIAYAPNGRRAVTASFDRSVRLWDVETGRELSRVDGQGWCTEAAFSFDGSLVLVSGGAEKNFQQRKWYEFPDERVRLYRVVNTPATAD